MKKISLCFLALFCLLVMNGCVAGAFWAVSTALSAKTAYNGYETLSGMKNVRDKTEVFRDYRVAFVTFDVQPKAGSSDEVDRLLERVYSRTLTGMAKDSGLNLACNPYTRAKVQASSDALIIQVRETKPSFWGKIMSGEKIHASIRYIDKVSATGLAEEDYGGIFKNYEEMVRTMTKSALAKLNGPAGSAQPVPEDQKKVYPIMTTKEKVILLQG